MKNALLFAAMAISLHLYGQDKEISPVHPGHSVISSHDVKERMHERNGKISPVHPDFSSGNAGSLSTRQQLLSIQRNDSTYIWVWDTIIHDWLYSYKEVDFMYDADDNITGLTTQIWEGGSWVNSDKYNNTYDANQNLISETSQSWNGNAWENYTQSIFTYNANHKITSLTFNIWNGSAWEKYSKSTYTYNANQQLTIRLDQDWNITVWENYEQNIFTYDTDGNNTRELIQLWNGSDWDNYSQYTRSYSAGHVFSAELTEFWNGASWDKYSLRTEFYDADTLAISELFQVWDGSAWVNNTLYAFEYDEYQNLTNYHVSMWAGNWVKSADILYVFDADNYLLSITSDYYNSTGTKVNARDSTYNYYHTVTALSDLAADEATVNVYPNPGNGVFTFSSDINIAAVEIYNTLGERVYFKATFTHPSSTQIDISDQGKGIYFIRFHSGTKTYCSKIIHL